MPDNPAHFIIVPITVSTLFGFRRYSRIDLEYFNADFEVMKLQYLSPTRGGEELKRIFSHHKRSGGPAVSMRLPICI
jgi:hypothetical protein